jgi:hypothetical protein
MKENLIDVMQGLLDEGIYDPSIFKAIFLAGGPGSGKSYVTRRTTGGLGMKTINPDIAFEKILRDAGESLDMRTMDPEKRDRLRLRAKNLTNAQMKLYVDGRLGLILDGTGKDYDKIKRVKGQLDTIGYDSYMIFVNTSLEVALESKRKTCKKTTRRFSQSLLGRCSTQLRKISRIIWRRSISLWSTIINPTKT